MTTYKTFRIHELDINTIPPCTKAENEDGSKIAIIGRPGSGKSFLIRDLIYAKKHIFPVAEVISGTEDSNKFFSSMFKDLFIHEKLDISLIQNFSKRQKIAKNYLGEWAWGLLVVDDCMDDISMFRNPAFLNLMKNGRHWKLLFILGLQYAMDILPALRICIDGCFIFREPNIRFRKILFENYASIFGDFKLFCKVMDEITDDHTALYVNNRATSNKIEDCVFWYKARDVGEFEFGCADYSLFNDVRLQAKQEQPF